MSSAIFLMPCRDVDVANSANVFVVTSLKLHFFREFARRRSEYDIVRDYD